MQVSTDIEGAQLAIRMPSHLARVGYLLGLAGGIGKFLVVARRRRRAAHVHIVRCGRCGGREKLNRQDVRLGGRWDIGADDCCVVGCTLGVRRPVHK